MRIGQLDSHMDHDILIFDLFSWLFYPRTQDVTRHANLCIHLMEQETCEPYGMCNSAATVLPCYRATVLRYKHQSPSAAVEWRCRLWGYGPREMFVYSSRPLLSHCIPNFECQTPPLIFEMAGHPT